MAYQPRRDKHRTTAREFRVVNAAAAHDFVLEVPGQTRLFVLLDIARQTNIAATAYRDVQRRTCATSICQRVCKAHVFNKTFGVKRALNAELFVATPHTVAMQFDLFGEGRVGHWVKGGSARELLARAARSRIDRNRKRDPRFLVLLSRYCTFRSPLGRHLTNGKAHDVAATARGSDTARADMGLLY